MGKIRVNLQQQQEEGAVNHIFKSGKQQDYLLQF